MNCDNLISLKVSSSPVSSKFLLVVSVAIRLHQSHESETLIIYQMFYNHETNVRLRIVVVTSV